MVNNLTNLVYMIFLICIQNLTTIGPVVSEIMCLIKIDTVDRQPDREKDRPKWEITFFVL